VAGGYREVYGQFQELLGKSLGQLPCWMARAFFQPLFVLPQFVRQLRAAVSKVFGAYLELPQLSIEIFHRQQQSIFEWAVCKDEVLQAFANMSDKNAVVDM